VIHWKPRYLEWVYNRMKMNDEDSVKCLSKIKSFLWDFADLRKDIVHKLYLFFTFLVNYFITKHENSAGPWAFYKPARI